MQRQFAIGFGPQERALSRRMADVPSMSWAAGAEVELHGPGLDLDT